MKPIITTLLDNDHYKLQMAAAMFHLHGSVEGEYAYTLRTPGIDLSGIIGDLREQLTALSELRYHPDEIKWLYDKARVPAEFLEGVLRKDIFDPRTIVVEKSSCEPGITLTVRGPIYLATFAEIYALSLISELYFKKLYNAEFAQIEGELLAQVENQVKIIQKLQQSYPEVPFAFSEFGTRRRYSAKLQSEVLDLLRTELPTALLGTSNLRLAFDRNIASVGTVAHEWFMLYQGIVHPADSQKQAIADWLEYYRGWNAIMLTDTLGSEKWERDFSLNAAQILRGLRHDSADPYQWAEKSLEQYAAMGLDPKEKTLLFSDNLTLEKAFRLTRTFHKRVGVSSGIGTSLSNPETVLKNGKIHKALSQVIKLVAVNGRPVAKLSDDVAKAQCPNSASHLEYMKYVAREL